MLSKEQIENIFTYHAPTGDQPERYERIRGEAKHLAYQINQLCPDGEEKNLAMARLQESVMWANASIARKV